MHSVRKMNLNDKICLWKEHPEDEEQLRGLFIAEEWDILNIIHKFEIFRNVMEEEENIRCRQDNMTVFIQAEKEMEISFELKEKFLSRIGVLLATKTVEAWLEIIIWYSLLAEKKLIIEDFWEFPVLRIMIDIFVKELNAFLEKGNSISILSLNCMQKLTDVYFKTVFLCRRIEFGIEPVKEIGEYIKEKNFSFAFIESIVYEAQIFNKEKVMEAVKGWYGNDDR